ncbi:TMEM175 family protein [Hymenobacter sp. M29]|uniref:TMEM175 family protein n=1 Tax=Hymenobacter mellowenesis TaxID=3063995 RepID=A0ABT9A5S1_9BACT|nr:TMEM175 family protein [Hymenobacter sp. M29]MDO7845171.1 TMEM175 family protein [Hymenobacter sp. M29]
MDGNEKAQHNREAFQLERLILFTDAVFAIAITLLVIELKVPELEHRTEPEAWHGFLRLIPKLVGFFISFFIIAIYWVAHHRIFRFVRHLDNKLIWLNMLFLLCIVLMPFTTAYQSEYAMLRTPWIIYSINIIATGLMQAQLQNYLRHPSPGVTAAHERTHPDLDLMRPLTSPIVFGLSIVLSFFVQPWTLRMVPAVVFPLLALLLRRRHQRLEQHHAQTGAARQHS